MTMIAFLLLAAAQGGAAKSECVEERTQMEIIACAAREFETADKAMNTAWKNAVGWFKNGKAPADYPSGKLGREAPPALLLKAQRAWLSMRDAHCQLSGYAHAGGGSMEPFIISRCKTLLTEQRTQELQDLMFEGE